MIFDEARLTNTAIVVRKLNPYANNYPLAEFVAHMKATAHESLGANKSGYVSTFGYVLSSYIDENGEMGVYSSVATDLVETAIEERKESI